MVKSIKKSALIILVAVIVSTITSAYYRDIQENIHDGIAWTYKKNETVGEFLYEANRYVLNGRAFDGERKIKDTIHAGFRSVVMIRNVTTDDNPAPQAGAGQGTGFFFKVDDEYGYIATNTHVVDQAFHMPLNFKLKVNTAVDYWAYDAEVIGVDEVADVAVIRIAKKDMEEWEALEFEDADNIGEGEPIVVIGHGLSLNYSATEGIINYYNRYGMYPLRLGIQIDAVVNQGNSGGPILNTDLKVVGVVDSILSPGRPIPGWDGVGMGVAISQVKRTIDYILSDEYKEKKYVPYSAFPLSFMALTYDEAMLVYQDVEPKDRKMVRIVVNEQTKDYPGTLAGLQDGDIILELNGKELRSGFKIIKDIILSHPGDEWTIKVRRGEEEIEVSFILEEMPREDVLKLVKRPKSGR
jgi:serine protease Do